MNFFTDIFRRQLTTSVGNNQRSDPQDVISTRTKLAALGHHSADTNRPYIDRELDQSIRGFQGDKGLKEDGVIHPNGETECSLNRNLSRLKKLGTPEVQPLSRLAELSAPVGDGQENQSVDVQNVQRTLGQIGLVSEKKMVEPNGIVDRETLDGIHKFQGQNNLRVDGKINPEGETVNAINALANLQETQKQRDKDGESEREKEKKNKKTCSQLSIDLQNQNLRIRSLNERLTEVNNQINPTLTEITEAKEALRILRLERLRDTAISGASKGAFGFIGAGVAHASYDTEIKAAEERLLEARELLKSLKREQKDIPRWKDKAWAAIAEIKNKMVELGCQE